jgi:hypothetical protein
LGSTRRWLETRPSAGHGSAKVSVLVEGLDPLDEIRTGKVLGQIRFPRLYVGVVLGPGFMVMADIARGMRKFLAGGREKPDQVHALAIRERAAVGASAAGVGFIAHVWILWWLWREYGAFHFMEAMKARRSSEWMRVQRCPDGVKALA